MTGRVYWLTGPPSSGKSTLARAAHAALRGRGWAALWLDGDDLRQVLGEDYSPEGRDRLYGVIGHLARLGAEGGALVLVSATGARRRWRDAVRAAVPEFAEVYLTADPETLRARDPKGLYARAAAGEIDSLPGVGVPYEPPLAPELTLDTASLDEATCLARLLALIDGSGR